MMYREQWHLTEGLVFAHFAVYFLGMTNPDGLAALELMPGQIAARPWTLVTYQFIHGGNLFWFFISMLVLWIMARPLEDSWGSLRFLVFWLVATLGASVVAALLGLPLVGNIGFDLSLLFTFATLFPDVEFRLFFLIPVKVKYLAVVAGAFLVYSGLTMGIGTGLAYVAGMSSGYLFFLATRRLPSRRKVVFEYRKRRAAAVVKGEDAAAEVRNRRWDAAVRDAVRRSRDAGRVDEQDHPLIAELEEARDPSVTVCAPSEFGFIDDPVCRSCAGYPECAARAIRLAAADDES